MAKTKFEQVNDRSGPEFEFQVAMRFQSMKQRAEARRLPFDLSVISVRNLLKTKYCQYTGEPIFLYPGDTTPKPDALSIERLDCKKGYVKGNVIAVSHRINTARNNLSPTDIAKIYRSMKKKGMVK